MHLDVELRLELAAAEQPHAVLGAAECAGLNQGFRSDHAGDIKLLGVDRLLHAIQIDLGEVKPENVVEAALRQTTKHRHLPALAALDAHAAARGLALATAACLLALTRSVATADAHALLARTGSGGDLAELHRPSPVALLLVDDADEMVNLGDHAANRRRIRQLGA